LRHRLCCGGLRSEMTIATSDSTLLTTALIAVTTSVHFMFTSFPWLT